MQIGKTNDSAPLDIVDRQVDDFLQPRGAREERQMAAFVAGFAELRLDIALFRRQLPLAVQPVAANEKRVSVMSGAPNTKSAQPRYSGWRTIL